MDRYHILYTTDKNYFSHMLTSIYSLLENNNEFPLTIHIIEQGFTSLDIRRLETLVMSYPSVNLKIYEWNESLKKIDIPKWRDSDIANARLFANDLIKDTKKLLYIDSDTIITDSLSELLNKNIQTPVAAVKDLCVPLHMRNISDNYYNSGVLLINYEIWEKEECSKKIYDTFHNTKIPLIYPDQDLLNLSLHEMITPLTVDYNIMPLISDLLKHPFLLKKYCKKYHYYSYDEIIKSLETPHLFHMLSYFRTRPWLENNVHPFNELYERYRKEWDNNFERENDINLIAQIPIIPFINILNSIYLPQSLNTEMKKFIKKKIKK